MYLCIYVPMYLCIYVYMVQRSKPPPPRPWSWVSHSTVPLPPCGVVGVWYCPPSPLWCGEGVVLHGW